MEPAPTTPPANQNNGLESEIPKLQKALNRVTNLTDRLSHSDYSSKYFLSSANNCAMDTKTRFLLILTASSLLIGFHLSLTDLNFISYRVVCALISLPLLYVFSLTKLNSLGGKLALFYFFRLASSSIVYSYLYKVSLPYQFHAKSHEYDILMSALCLTLAALISPTEAFKVEFYRGLQFPLDLVISVALQSHFKQAYDPFGYFYQIILFGFVSLACHLITRKANQDKNALESGVLKHCEEISKELKEIHDNLKEEEGQPTPVKAPTSSLADQILTKVKYLKFKLMQEEKERRFLNTKNSVFGPTKRSLMKGFSTLALTSKADKKLLDTIALTNQRRGSFKDQDRSPPGEQQEQCQNENNDDGLVDKWQISAKDCDSLIKMILEKHTNIYYPEVLTETNNQINNETAEFLKQHFTEIGNNLLASEFKYERSNSLVNESKAFAFSPWNDYLETNACSWNFDMLKFKDLTNGRHIPEYGSYLFKKFNILKTLHTSPTTAVNFLKDVSEGYLCNPYHNSIHGADVANSIAYFLNNQEFRDNFNDLEASCLLVAALVHDLGHPGFNNAFLIATKSTEALLYNDQSVLENLHTAYYYKILQKPSSNILQNLPEKDQKFYRKLSIGLILDTDLTKHFVILTKFKGISDQINLEQEENRFLSLSIALKCADVGHGAKELSLHKKWSRRIIEEFYLQGDKERQHGIPVSPLCDRAGKVSNSQQGFLNFIVLPLYDAFDKKFFSEKMREEVTNQVTRNLEYWNEEIPKEERGECMFKEETQKILEDIQNEMPIVK